jgi:hypothetical protein
MRMSKLSALLFLSVIGCTTPQSYQKTVDEKTNTLINGDSFKANITVLAADEFKEENLFLPVKQKR